MEEDFNPYAAPQTESRPVDETDQAIRMKNLRRESHVKAVGLLIIFVGFLSLLVVGAHKELIQQKMDGLAPPLRWLVAVSVVLPMFAGIGLCRLWRWGWMLSVFCYGIPTVVNLYGTVFLHTAIERLESSVALLVVASVLLFLLSPKTRRVFAPSYAGIMAATPDLRSPVATWGWVLLFLGVGLALFTPLGL